MNSASFAVFIFPRPSILSFLLCLGLSMVEGVILENLFFPLSKVSFFNPDAQRIEKYWRCVSICHMGCSQSNFHQTDVIYQPLSEDATLKQQAREEPESERKKKKKGTKEWSGKPFRSSRQHNIRPHMLQCMHTDNPTEQWWGCGYHSIVH